MSNPRKRLKLTRQAREKFARIRRLDQIQRLDPIEFEQFVGYLYQKEGYRVSMTVTSGDEGVDLYLSQGMKRFIVQCKRYAGTVGQPIVRDLYGAMYHNKVDAAVLVTSGTISRPAEEWAYGKPITLIDGHELVSWNRRIHSVAAPLYTIPWTRIGLVMGAAVLLALVTVALVWGWRTFSNRTASPGPLPPPPTQAADDDLLLPTAPPEATNTAAAPAATVTLSFDTSGLVNAGRFAAPPTIDAILTEWSSIPAFETPYVVASADSWDGSRDLEAAWRLGWDDAALYVGVTIVDNLHVQTRDPKFAYLGDSLELQIDTNLNGDYGAQVSPDDFQFILSPGDFAGREPGTFRFRGNESGGMDDAPGTSVSIAARRTESGYTLEAAIPWTDLNLGRPEPGTILGAALSTNDNDTPDTAVQELMLSHVATRRWRDPTSWGSLRLEP